MQGQREQSQEATIEELQSQINELTAENLLLKEQLARKEQFIAMIAHALYIPATIHRRAIRLCNAIPALSSARRAV